MGNYFVLEYNRKSLLESKADHEKFMKWISDGFREHGYRGARMSDWGINVYAKSAYDTFMKAKPSLKSPENDMYHWMRGSFPDFLDFISNEQKRLDDEQRLRDAENEGSKLVYSDGDWKVYEVTNYEASAKYGKNTKWCISGSKRWNDGNNGKAYFQRYHDEQDVRFFFFIDQRNNRKYALCLYPNSETWEIYNDHDIRVPSIPNAPLVDEIVDIFGTRESMDEGVSQSQEDFFRDSVVRNRDGELLPMWHCSTDTFTKFRNRINWFSVSKEYARQFGLSKPVFYQAYLNCRRLLNCGDTGQPVYLPFPTRKVLSPAILRIADRLGISKDEMEELCQYAIEDNQKEGSDGKGMKVHAVTRTDAFAEKAREKGFDGIHTIEDGHHCIGVLNPRDIKRVTNLEPTDSQDIDESIWVTEMKSKGILDDQHIQDLVDECIDRCREIDMSGVQFDGYPDLGGFYQEITFNRIFVEVGDAMRTFGTFLWGDDDSPDAGGTIILNKYMFSEPDETIKNTIYHELCHYIVWQLGCWTGIYYKLDGNWRIDRGLVVRPSDWDSHGRIWQNVAEVVGSAVGQKITRTDSYKNHTGVGSHAEDRYKYIVKCKHCGNVFKYAKRTKFVTAVLDGRGHADRWWCNCKDGFKSHDFEILKGE